MGKGEKWVICHFLLLPFHAPAQQETNTRTATHLSGEYIAVIEHVKTSIPGGQAALGRRAPLRSGDRLGIGQDGPQPCGERILPPETIARGRDPAAVSVTVEPVTFRTVQCSVETIGTLYGYEEVSIAAKLGRPSPADSS